MSADVGAWWPSLLGHEAAKKTNLHVWLSPAGGRTCILAKPGIQLSSSSTSWMCEACIQMFWLSPSL